MKRLKSSLNELPFSDYIVEFEQYQKNSLCQIITWINRLIIFGIVLNSIWFVWEFWPTLTQNMVFLGVAAIGWWCIHLIRNDRFPTAANLYLSVTMIAAAAIIPTIGPFFAAIGTLCLCLFVLLAMLLTPKSRPFLWGSFGAILFAIAFTIMWMWPIRDIPLQPSDIFGLYIFLILSIVGFTLLGRNISIQIRQALSQSKAAQIESDQSYRALGKSQQALKNSNQALQHELQERIQIEKELRNYQDHLEELVVERTARLEALHAFDTAILEADTFLEISGTVITYIVELIPCDFAWVTVLDNQKQEVSVLGRIKSNHEYQEVNLQRPLNSISHLAEYHTGEDREVFDIEALAGVSPNEQEMIAYGIRSYFSAPVTIHGELAAILSVGKSSPSGLSPENKTIIKEVVGSVALSLQKAQLQASIKNHLGRLELSLDEKDVLLREVHHRVKNNLQIITSLLNLQAGQQFDQGVRKILMDSQNRIRALALVHEKMYRSENLSQISQADLIRELVSGLSATYRAENINISMNIQASDIYLQANTAVPLGLIINELITNAIKHADPEQSDIEILVDLSKRSSNQVELSVTDNGKGLPENFDIRNTKTLGFQLISKLVEQIHGQLEIKNSNGAQISVVYRYLNEKNKEQVGSSIS
jgi:two-component sensor histidine kinase